MTGDRDHLVTVSTLKLGLLGYLDETRCGLRLNWECCVYRTTGGNFDVLNEQVGVVEKSLGLRLGLRLLSLSLLVKDYISLTNIVPLV